MDIAEKVLRQKKDFDDVYEAGKKAEYDAFWDGVQYYGNRSNYSQAFAYAWNDESFKPKYDIKCAGAYATYQIFYNTKIVDLVGCLKKANVKFDTTEATVIQGIFDRAGILINTPPIDAINCTSMQLTYSSAQNVKNIEIANIQENCTFDRVFNNMYELRDVVLINCTIGKNGISFQWSTKLTADSLKSIIQALSTTTTGLTITLPTTAQSNYEKVYGSGSWATLTATRSNWTIAYA
jgi:hypothetical protein